MILKVLRNLNDSLCMLLSHAVQLDFIKTGLQVRLTALLKEDKAAFDDNYGRVQVR